jgi:hypothetical protein
MHLGIDGPGNERKSLCVPGAESDAPTSLMIPPATSTSTLAGPEGKIARAFLMRIGASLSASIKGKISNIDG